MLCEFLILDPSVPIFPTTDVRLHTSSTTKLSPSFPHRTTLSSCGFSSILEGQRSVRVYLSQAQSRLLVKLANLDKC